ncbi:MAG: hypothetical protein JWL81_62 [Verrucomicrobiales bacterium]|nr:hypothetical protein [Verrucomicrobiales bacterium]
MPLPAESGPIPCLYECSVMHRRLSPQVHQFTYHLFFFCLDLDALPSLTARIPYFSHNRFNLYNFRDRDHLTLEGMEKASLKENILAWIRTQADAPALPTDPAALRVHLVTLPRVLGYIFNPVSFFFLSDAATAAPLCAVVQVGNTFRELKPYLLTSLVPDPAPADAPSSPAPPTYRLTVPKHFYVSPFSALDLHFDFHVPLPDSRLHIRINDLAGPDGPPVLLSTLAGKRVPFTAANLFWLTLKFPFVTLKVIFLIHYQALRLWLRKLPFHRKGENSDLQKDLWKPNRNPADR